MTEAGHSVSLLVDWLVILHIFFPHFASALNSLSSFLFISHPFFLTFSLQHVFQVSCGSHDSRHSIDFVRSIPLWSLELTLCTSNGASPACKSCPESGSLALDFLPRWAHNIAFPQKPIITPKNSYNQKSECIFIATIFLNLSQGDDNNNLKEKRKASRTYKLVITVIFNDKLPTGYQHLAHRRKAWTPLISFITAQWHFRDVFLITLTDSLG